MTMQVAPAPVMEAPPTPAEKYSLPATVAPAAGTSAPSRLYPTWITDIKPALIGRLRTALADTLPGAAGLGDHDVLARMGLLTASGDLTPEALLLFGTEHALAQAYPFLKTSTSRRNLDRYREKVTDLPRNLIRQIDGLLDFLRDQMPPAPETMQAEPDAPATDRTSLRDATLFPWIFEMAISRDYEQIKPARFVRDNHAVFLEYPRTPEDREYEASPYRYQVNKTLESVLARLYPHLHAAYTMQVEHEKSPYFASRPLRTEGRFFKTTAILSQAPGITGTQPTGYHASLNGEMARVAPAPETMQVEGPRKTPPAPAASMPAQPPPSSSLPFLKPSSPTPAPASRQPVAAPAAVRTRPTAKGHPGASKRPASPPDHRQHPSLPAPSPEPSPEATFSRNPADRTARILEFCRTPRHREEIQKHVGMNNRDYFRKDVLNRLIAQGLLAPTLPDKPNSPKQQYITVSA